MKDHIDSADLSVVLRLSDTEKFIYTDRGTPIRVKKNWLELKLAEVRRRFLEGVSKAGQRADLDHRHKAKS